MAYESGFIYFPFIYKEDGTPKDIDWFSNGANGFKDELHIALTHNESMDRFDHYESVLVAVFEKTTEDPPKNHIKYIRTSYNPNFKVGDMWFKLHHITMVSIQENELMPGLFKLPSVGDLTGYNNFNKLY